MPEWIALDYMTGFECIGPRCEDTCCANWEIAIDKDTLKLYQKLQHPRLTVLIEHSVVPVVSPPDAQHAATITPRPDGSCAFLNEEKLCDIQCELGEQALSQTCSLFPRSQSAVFGTVELSANMSCPEAARLALLNPAGIHTAPVSASISPRATVISRTPQSKIPFLLSTPELLQSIRNATWELIQNRRYSVSDRLILLGMLLQRIEPQLLAGNEKQARGELVTLLSEAQAGTLQESLEAIPSVTTLQVKLLKELTDRRILAGRVHSRFLACYEEFCSGLKVHDGMTDEELGASYSAALTHYFAPFEREYGYILENYLINYVFKGLFPAGGYGGVFDDFVMLTVHYATIKLLLVGMAAKHRGLTEENAVRLIQSFSRTIEHNSSFLQAVLGLLAANNLRTLPHMAILLKG